MLRAEPAARTAAPITREVLFDAATDQWSNRLIEINSGEQVFKDAYRGHSNFSPTKHRQLLQHLQTQSQEAGSDIQRYLKHADPFLKALKASNHAALAEQKAYQATAEAGDRSTFNTTGYGRDISEDNLKEENIQTDHLKLLTVYILRHPSVEDLAGESLEASPETIMQTFQSRPDVLREASQAAPLGLNPHAVQLMALTQQYGQVASTQDKTKTLSGLFPSRLGTEAAFNSRSLQLDSNAKSAHSSVKEVIQAEDLKLNIEGSIQTREDGLSVRLTEHRGPRTAHQADGQNLRVNAFDLDLSIEITVAPYDPNDPSQYSSTDPDALLSFGQIAKVTQAEGRLSLTSDHLTLITATSLLGSSALTSKREQNQQTAENAILWAPLSRDQLQAQINRATILLQETMENMPELQSLLEAYGYENIGAVFDDDFKTRWLEHATNPQFNPQHTLDENPKLKEKEELLLFISRCHITHPTQQRQICQFLQQDYASETIKHCITRSQIGYADFTADDAGDTSDQLLDTLTSAHPEIVNAAMKRAIKSDRDNREFQKNLNTSAITAGTVICLALVVLTVSPISWFTPGIAATCLLSGTGIATWLNIRRKLFNSPNISSYSNVLLSKNPNAMQQIISSQNKALIVIVAVAVSLIITAAVFFPTLPGTMYTLATQAIGSAMITPLGMPIALLAMTSIVAGMIAIKLYKESIKRPNPSKSRRLIAGGTSVLIALIISAPATLPLLHAVNVSVLTGLAGTLPSTIIGVTTATAFTSILMGLGILAAIALTTWIVSTSIYRFSKGTTQPTDAKIIQSILKAQKTLTPEALRALSPPVSPVSSDVSSDVSSGSENEEQPSYEEENQAQPSQPSSIVDALFNHTITLTGPDINAIQGPMSGENYLDKFKRETVDSDGKKLADEGAHDDLSSLPEDTQSAIAALLFQTSPIAPAQILARAKTMTSNHANPLDADNPRQVEVIGQERRGKTAEAQISRNEALNTVTVSQTKTYKVTNQDTGKVVSIPMTASTTLTLSEDNTRVLSAKTALTTLSTEHQAAISRVIVAKRITQDQALHTGEQGTHGGYAPIAKTMADPLETYLQAITQEALRGAPDTEEASKISENMGIMPTADNVLVKAVEPDDAALSSAQEDSTVPARVLEALAAARSSEPALSALLMQEPTLHLQGSDAASSRASGDGFTVSDAGDDAPTSPPSNKAKYVLIGVGVSLTILMIGSAINVFAGLFAIKATTSMITLALSAICLLGVAIYACTRKDSNMDHHITMPAAKTAIGVAESGSFAPSAITKGPHFSTEEGNLQEPEQEGASRPRSGSSS